VKKLYFACAFIAIVALQPIGPVHAYGGSGGGAPPCQPPLFFEQAPADNTTVKSLDRFLFVASENTDAKTLKVAVNGEPVDLAVTVQRSGRLVVEGILKNPIAQPGKVRISLSAKSREGCNRTLVYSIRVAGPEA
jgi:hypothetical protein